MNLHPEFRGFTLVEMAVVLVIVGLMLGGLLVPLATQMEVRSYNETNKKLDEIKEVLIGYAMINGRLPCPAPLNSTNGLEDTAPACSNTVDAASPNVAIGYLPATTLGVYPQDSSQLALDGWGGNAINRIRYAVALPTPVLSPTTPFTTTNGIRLEGISYFANKKLLYVCKSQPTSGLPYTDCNTGTSALTDSAAFVVYSVGKNAATGGTSADEAVNPNPNSPDTSNNDLVFVSHTPDSNFDDSMIWATTSELISKLVSAGQLP